ncbi:MAG: NADH-quinone oxidoreductase subunit F, partial [Syntrophales bacterium]|nr:NADH-quinone oxidoreductase subunit F [Syntrophales bacterium]
MSKILKIEDLNEAKKRGLIALMPKKIKIMVGMATSGIASGAGDVYAAIAAEIKKRRLDIILSKTGSMGMDCMEPLVDVLEPGKPRLSYGKMTVKKAPVLIDQLLKGSIESEKPFSRMDEEDNIITAEKNRYFKGKLPHYLKAVPSIWDVDFYRKQVKLATRNCGMIDPESIDEYIAKRGYFSLYKVLSGISPDEVIEEVVTSGLRGRGGGGFPTGIKWR